MLDKYIHGSVERISPEAPVPIVLKNKEEFKPGGAANVALNLATLGAKVTLMTSIAEDSDGKKVLDILDSHGIKTIMGNSAHTIVKTRIVAHNQQIVRIDDEKEKKTYNFELNDAHNQFIRDAINENDIILLSDYNKGVLTQELVDLVAQESKLRGKFVALDPKPSNRIKFSGFDLITPNRKEANELVGKSNLELVELVIRLDERYETRILAITLSEDGLALSENGAAAKVYPAMAREVFSVCGAGDTSISLLCLTLGNNIPINEAAFLTNVACGIVVGKHGTATTNQQEILQWAANLG